MKNMRLSRLAAIGMAAAMAVSILGGCAGSGSDTGSMDNSEASAGVADKDGIVKPKKITIMVDGTVTTKVNDRDAFVKKWEELTGIELEIIQPDHDAYYDVLGQTFASGPENWPDAILLSSSYYSGYAEEGALWDMTDAWNNSELKASGRVTSEDVIDNMKLDGKLFGFPVTHGNGTVTYVKKAWLDRCGLDAPTTYDEYMNMLKAFTEGDPDGNGVNGDTYGVTAPGIIAKESPYVNYLPEFYQDAYPSFAEGKDGIWYDGFTQDNFKAALNRLRDAYEKGYIDKETLTNGTNDCRNKFYEDKCGVLTYWAGTWDTNLKRNLEANGFDGELVPLKPIKEVGTYIERIPPVWAVTSACKNPEGVYKYLIESMLDGGDMEMLWTYGVEGIHWSDRAETVCGNVYTEGQFHQEESLEKPGTQYTKQHIDPLLSIARWDSDPGKDAVAPEARQSQMIFNDNCRQAQLVPPSEEMAQYNGDLTTLKNSIIADVVVQGTSIDEAYARFEKDGGAKWSRMIVDSLNKK